MKFRKISIVLMLFAMFASFTATASSSWYAVNELVNAIPSRWQQTYQAYGRTIDIDVTYEIPSENHTPVLRVKHWVPISQDERAKWITYFSKPNDSDQGLYGFNVIEHQGIIVFAYNVFDTTDLFGKTKQIIGSDPRADWKHTYAEDNPQSMWDAFLFSQDKLSEICGEDIPLYPLHGGTLNRLRDKSTGKALREHGNYELILAQTFQGFPLIETIFNTYTDPNPPANGEPYHYKDAYCIIYDKNSYNISARLYQTVETIAEDIPLKPFDAGKQQIEDLIKRGLIRDIYNIRLAYALFHDPDDLNNSFYLIPSWIVSCDFYRSSEAEPVVSEWAEMYWNHFEYHNLILNAQTGQLYDPFSTAIDRFLAPDIIKWEDAGK